MINLENFILLNFLNIINFILASVPLFHTKHNSLESWNRPEIEKIVNKALELKSHINKLSSQNTWTFKAVVTAGEEDFKLLTVCESYLRTTDFTSTNN